LVASSVTLPAMSFARNFMNTKNPSSNPVNPILNTKALGFIWETTDPFLFCVHHEDAFPKGDDNMGPGTKYLQGCPVSEPVIQYGRL
jgi:hypothetical protein